MPLAIIIFMSMSSYSSFLNYQPGFKILQTNALDHYMILHWPKTGDIYLQFQ